MNRRTGCCIRQNAGEDSAKCVEKAGIGKGNGMDQTHRIFCLMGKSASGKDTIYGKLRARAEKDGNTLLGEVVPYTTRPIRTGEKNGISYYFETDPEFEEARRNGAIIESRDYDTVYGIWHYYTKDDGQIDLNCRSYLLIGTLESYEAFVRYFGEDRVVPLYVELEAGERLQRALNRERSQEHPRYAELCRRFLSDEQDFSEEKLQKAGIRRRFVNTDADQCTEEIWMEICRKLVLNR